MSARYLILVPAGRQAECNALAKQDFDAAGGELTFTVPLFATAAPDDTAPSFYVASAAVDAPLVPVLHQLAAALPDCLVEPYDLDADPGYPQRRFAELGLRAARPLSFP